MNNKGKFNERINHRLHLLGLINGCLESEYEKCEGNPDENKKYLDDLDAFAMGISKTLSETLTTIIDSFPYKIKEISPSTHPMQFVMALSLKGIKPAIYKVLKQNNN